jgi:hypothetical protein
MRMRHSILSQNMNLVLSCVADSDVQETTVHLLRWE